MQYFCLDSAECFIYCFIYDKIHKRQKKGKQRNNKKNQTKTNIINNNKTQHLYQNRLTLKTESYPVEEKQTKSTKLSVLYVRMEDKKYIIFINLVLMKSALKTPGEQNFFSST